MRFFTVSDIHFGASSHLGKVNPETGIHSRLEDFGKSFDKAIELAVEYKADVFLIAGDIYETPNPTSIQQREFAKRLRKLSDLGFMVIIDEGNHDYKPTEHKTSSISILQEIQIPNVHICNEPQVIEFDEVSLVVIPYIYRQMVPCEEGIGKATFEQANDYYVDLAQDLIKSCKSDKVIAMAHQTIEGTVFNDYQVDLSLLSELTVPPAAFEGSSFTVVGHIHKHQVVSEDPLIIIPGSHDRSKIDDQDQKGCIAFDTDTDKWEFIKLETRNLLDISIDVTEADNPTESIIKRLKSEPIEGAIVRVKLKIKESDYRYLDEQEISKHLKSAKHLLGIKVDVVREHRVRNSEVNETISPFKALEEYFKDCKDLTASMDDLLVEGTLIISEVDNLKDDSSSTTH